MGDSAQRTLRAATIEQALEILDSGGSEIVMPVAGDSMLPTLRPGQRVYFERSPGPLRRGDLVVARNPANPEGRLGDAARPPLVVHRLLGIVGKSGGRRYLRLRGDGRNNLDPRVEPEWVVGRVLAVKCREGWRSLRNPGARFYANLVALHDLFWSVVGVASRGVDRALRLPAVLGRSSAALDRTLLRLAHLACYRFAHSRCAEPHVNNRPMPDGHAGQP
jgi:hypothetical protein